MTIIDNIKQQLSEIGKRVDVKYAVNEVLDPFLKYATKKLDTLTVFLQIIMVLIVSQILAILFLIINEFRRYSA